MTHIDTIAMIHTPAFHQLSEISVETLATQLADPQELLLLDVREPEEVEFAQIPGFSNAAIEPI